MVVIYTKSSQQGWMFTVATDKKLFATNSIRFEYDNGFLSEVLVFIDQPVADIIDSKDAAKGYLEQFVAEQIRFIEDNSEQDYHYDFGYLPHLFIAKKWLREEDTLLL